MIHESTLQFLVDPEMGAPSDMGQGAESPRRVESVPRPTGRQPRRRRSPEGIPAVDPHRPYLVTVSAAADELSVSVRMVFKLVAAGTLPAVRLGRATRIATADLVSLVEDLRGKPQPGPNAPAPAAARVRRSRAARLPRGLPDLPHSPRGRRPAAGASPGSGPGRGDKSLAAVPAVDPCGSQHLRPRSP